MSPVVDSNLFIAAALGPPASQAVRDQIRRWYLDGAELHAPWLFRYEIANALTRLVGDGRLSAPDADAAWEQIDDQSRNVEFHDIDHGPRVIAVTRQLKRQSAYDAAYVALAHELRTDLWTTDGPLYRNAASSGLPVKFIQSL